MQQPCKASFNDLCLNKYHIHYKPPSKYIIYTCSCYFSLIRKLHLAKAWKMDKNGTEYKRATYYLSAGRVCPFKADIKILNVIL